MPWVTAWGWILARYARCPCSVGQVRQAPSSQATGWGFELTQPHFRAFVPCPLLGHRTPPVNSCLRTHPGPGKSKSGNSHGVNYSVNERTSIGVTTSRQPQGRTKETGKSFGRGWGGAGADRVQCGRPPHRHRISRTYEEVQCSTLTM